MPLRNGSIDLPRPRRTGYYTRNSGWRGHSRSGRRRSFPWSDACGIGITPILLAASGGGDEIKTLVDRSVSERNRYSGDRRRPPARCKLSHCSPDLPPPDGGWCPGRHFWPPLHEGAPRAGRDGQFVGGADAWPPPSLADAGGTSVRLYGRVGRAPLERSSLPRDV